jgi:glycosyltransferase involved in cell wall biosynthesis
MSSYRAADFFVRPLSLQEQPLVSIITPVYNGDEFLSECIESVLAQSYQNWDYTIVNNRSADRTLEIAQSYAAKDSRIRIHDNAEFLPIIQNHNHAIRQISPQSKYCKVVLADDWLFPECIMKMVALSEANPSVGLVGAYGLDGYRVIWGGSPYPSIVVPGREACRRRLLGGPYVFGAPTASLVRSVFVRKQEKFYDESNLHADTTACFRILQEADFGFVHQVLTFTRTRRASNTSFASSINSFHLGWLTDLVQFGPLCLDEKEYRDRLQFRLTDYYQFLAESALQLRDSAFWDFHKDWLRTLGIPFSPGRLFKALCVAVGRRLSHPIQSGRSILHWWPRALSRKLSNEPDRLGEQRRA